MTVPHSKSFLRQHRNATRLLRAKGKSEPKATPEERYRRVRLGEVRRILLDRCGPELPDDDAGREYLAELFNVIALGPGDTIEAMIGEAGQWAPWLDPSEAERLACKTAAKPRKYLASKADTLAARLRFTYADRERLRVRTIGACDVTKEERAELRKKRDRERKAQQRRARGVKPRPAYLAEQAATPKPWITERISRATWYRKQKANETGCVRVAPCS